MAYLNTSYLRARRRAKKKKGTLAGLLGLGGASDCGADQVWCADYVFPGLPAGQCVTKAQCDQWHVDHPPAQQASNITDDIGSVANAITKIFGGQPQAAVPTVVSTGPSTTELALLGGAALLGVYLLTRK